MFLYDRERREERGGERREGKRKDKKSEVIEITGGEGHGKGAEPGRCD